jgi:putative membrane protein
MIRISALLTIAAGLAIAGCASSDTAYHDTWTGETHRTRTDTVQAGPVQAGVTRSETGGSVRADLNTGTVQSGTVRTDVVRTETVQPGHIEGTYDTTYVGDAYPVHFASNEFNHYFHGPYGMPINDKHLTNRYDVVRGPAAVAYNRTYVAPKTDTTYSYNRATVDESGRVYGTTGATVNKEPQLGSGNDKNTVSVSLTELDRTFINEAAAGGMFEVNASQKALLKAQGANIKTLAQQIVDDHTRANNELKNLASRKGMNQLAGLTPDQNAMIARLDTLSGSEFDAEFIAQQRKVHEVSIAKFQTAASSATDKDLRDWAATTLPTLRKHLDMVNNQATGVIGIDK